MGGQLRIEVISGTSGGDAVWEKGRQDTAGGRLEAQSVRWKLDGAEMGTRLGRVSLLFEGNYGALGGQLVDLQFGLI